jgi:energy-coupling factor transport system permease protein
MRSPFSYTPRPGPLQAAAPAAAVAYLGSLIAVAFLYSNPLVLAAVLAASVLAGLFAAAREAVRAALRMGLSLAVLITLVNALVISRGDTVLARLGQWPLLGRVDVTAEALFSGLVLGLRAAAVIVAFSIYSACVDPDRVLRALRPIAGRSALTATLVSRLVPVAAADAARLREASLLRGPGAVPLGRGALARRLLAGSLDRSVDVAATLELRGYGLGAPRSKGRGESSRHDARFFLTAALVLTTAIAAKALGADRFSAYPAIELGLSAPTCALCALILGAGLAPLRRRRKGAICAQDLSAEVGKRPLDPSRSNA